MLSRIAERSSGLLRVSMSTRAVRSRSTALPPSLKSMTVWPSWSRSPECSGDWSTGWPLTKVPLAEPRSTIRIASCRPAGARRGGGRPRYRGAGSGSSCPAPGPRDLDLNSNRLPWSAPWITNKEATDVSSPLLESDERSPSEQSPPQANRRGDDRQHITPKRLGFQEIWGSRRRAGRSARAPTRVASSDAGASGLHNVGHLTSIPLVKESLAVELRGVRGSGQEGAAGGRLPALERLVPDLDQAFGRPGVGEVGVLRVGL